MYKMIIINLHIYTSECEYITYCSMYSLSLVAHTLTDTHIVWSYVICSVYARNFVAT